MILVWLNITLAAASLLCLYRIIKGPTPFDRLVGLNLMVSNITAIIVILAVHFGRKIYLDAALIYALLGFISVVGISKYLEGRKMHE